LRPFGNWGVERTRVRVRGREGGTGEGLRGTWEHGNLEDSTTIEKKIVEAGQTRGSQRISTGRKSDHERQRKGMEPLYLLLKKTEGLGAAVKDVVQ